MNTLGQRKPTKKPQQRNANPFASALAETEHALSRPQQNANPGANPFSEALARTGGRFDSSSAFTGSDQTDAAQPSPDELKRQQEEMERKKKKEALKKKLHEKVNPTDMKDVFDARKKKTAQELEKTRQELKALAADIAGLRRDIDIAAMKHVVEPGEEGTYDTNYFHQFRSFIMLLRKQIKSARTWMKQAQAKKSKKKKKSGKKPGLEVGGGKHEQGKSVFDMMHHERSSSYTGN